MQRAPLVIAKRLLVQLTCDVSRDVAHDETDDLLVDTALATVDCIANGDVELRRTQSARRERGKVDEAARRLQRVKVVNAAFEVVFDESLSWQPRLPLFDELTPGVCARVVDRPGVIRVRRDLAM